MNRGADRRTREHLVQDEPDQAKQWIKQVAESAVFKEYTGDASTIDDGEIGMPIAVLPSVDEFRERSPDLRDGSESVARMLDQIRESIASAGFEAKHRRQADQESAER